MLTSVETAGRIFDQPGLATDLLVYCRPGYGPAVRAAISRDIANAPDAALRRRLVARDDVEAEQFANSMWREGVFTALFVYAFAVGILVVLVTSGVGQSERRREVGILKATGWQTDELLLRSLVESSFVSVAAASLSVVLAVLWLRILNGFGVAGVFLAGADWSPSFRVPSRLTPVPALLAYLIAVIVVTAGSLVSTWRTATTPPREAMR